MQFETNHIYHIYNRGNNSQQIFFNHKNYLFFLEKIRKHILPFADILAWCLMPNHFHLMVYTHHTEIQIDNTMIDSIDKFGVNWGTSSNFQRTFNKSIAIMLSSYTRAINNQENRNGSLFQITTKAICLSDNSQIAPSWFQTYFGTAVNIPDPEKSYPQVCFNYIHENPVKSKLAAKTEDWEFSSYRDYTGLRNGSLVNKERSSEFGLTIY